MSTDSITHAMVQVHSHHYLHPCSCLRAGMLFWSQNFEGVSYISLTFVFLPGKIQVVISRRSQTPLSQQSLQWFTPTWIWLGPNLLKSILERRSKSIGSGFSATRIFTREEEINHQTLVTSLLSRVVTSLWQRPVLLCQPIWFRTSTCTLWLYVLFMHCISKMISTAINDEFKGYRTPGRPHLSRDILKLRLGALRLVRTPMTTTLILIMLLCCNILGHTRVLYHIHSHPYWPAYIHRHGRKR